MLNNILSSMKFFTKSANVATTTLIIAFIILGLVEKTLTFLQIFPLIVMLSIYFVVRHKIYG